MQDAVVIGAGQSGPFLAARLAAAGQKVTLVEKRRLGGTCVNDGCIPTKTLVASARAAWVARSAAQWGVEIGGAIHVDMKRVKARKDAVVDESRRGLDTWLGGMENLTLVHGHARFVGDKAIEVGGERIEGKRFFLNTGCSAVMPDVLRDVALTHTEMMDIDALPAHLVIVGASYIALEFAQMYRRFGSEVTVIARGPRLLSNEDDDVAAAVAAVLTAEGVRIRYRTNVTRAVRGAGGGVVLTLRAEGAAEERVEASHLLAAIGRAPNSGDLGLDRAGVKTDAHGFITVDDLLRTSAPDIWALGDVNGRGAFTHTSYNDYEIVAANVLDGAQRSVADRIFIAGLYVDPPLGRVGMNERQARASGKRVLVGVRPMTRVGRARERGETAGFMKILVDADTDQILGASLLGVEADEAVHAIAATMTARAPYTVLRSAVFAHPTVSELIPTVLGELSPLAAG